jgi:hypothetical protein
MISDSIHFRDERPQVALGTSPICAFALQDETNALYLTSRSRARYVVDVEIHFIDGTVLQSM